MRLWHKDLISVLPRQQLLSQWRECCCIARNISINGTPNHILVNKILDYPIIEFIIYTSKVHEEMTVRGYKCDWSKFMQWLNPSILEIPLEYIFKGWHNNRYLKQCLYNLQEKYDCGGISDKEWYRICQFVVDKCIIM